MNYLVFPTLGLGCGLFLVGFVLSKKIVQRGKRIMLAAGAIVLAVPWLISALAYAYRVKYGAWFYEIRALPMTEMMTAGGGLLFGLIHRRLMDLGGIVWMIAKWFLTVLFFVLVFTPFMGPVLQPIQWKEDIDDWTHDVCMQTTDATCGPACVATILRLRGQRATEREIAEETFAYGGGTETWYLLRALRRRNVDPDIVVDRRAGHEVRYPSIAAVTVRDRGDLKHFIVIFEKTEAGYIVGDPLEGRLILSPEKLHKTYGFAGVYLVIRD